MSSFANEKESAGSNLRKEIALNNDTEVRAVLNEAEYVQYIQDLDNDRELTFKGKNVMDYSENEKNSFSLDDRRKLRKLRELQTRIKSFMLRARNQANNEERGKSLEERRRVLREKKIKEREVIRKQNEKIKEIRKQEAIKKLENINLLFEPVTIKNKDIPLKHFDNSNFLEELEKKRKEENLILRGKIIALQEILRDINLGPEEEIITNKDLEDKGFIRPTLQISEDGTNTPEDVNAIFEANRKVAESLEDKKKFFDILIGQVTKKAEKIPNEEIKNEYRRFLNFLKSGMEIKEPQVMEEYMKKADDPSSSLKMEQMEYILEADFDMRVLFVIFSSYALEVINPEDLYSKKYLSLRKEKDYKKLYTKYKYKYLKLKGKLN